MAAINNSMTNQDGTRPVEFPEEKIILSYDDVQLRISLSAPGRVYDAHGSIFLTNKRIVFLSPAHESIRSLSVLLQYVADGYLAQPLLGANRWEATILPGGSGSGIDDRGDRGDRGGENDNDNSDNDYNQHTYSNGFNQGADLKVWFSQGSTFEFYQGVEEARERLGAYSNAPQNEPLPKYESESNHSSNPTPDYSYQVHDDSVHAAMAARGADADANEERQQGQENPPPYSSYS
ncbi:hypothetical protein E3P89_02985 [Wallemia ichthyophaga]|uniref:GRAM domain-containing protein n=1 Tax=Wallemia ichthyophaga TaxID=245174 RepID=A0A4T0HYT6_WALIC|nr:hypothetical protein E3P90_03006 [Wallemia ichthyophaga]TIB10096.1 hypothetical protein E3P93_03010 [Wallemia ichthyophaga]TIB20803.1 hypothetical protein E3P89_02985 [Wallemia ichthyophaga]TIB22595.1 hypothetical protein E3P88_02976 [Wallemia ichthyophaga]